VAEILGIYREKLPAYASSMTRPTIEAFVDEALACKERGYQGFKIHAVGDPDIDIKLCTAAPKALGDSYALMIDVVFGYDQYQALRAGRALEDLGFLWYEEPLREYDIHGCKMLADQLDIPIAVVDARGGHRPLLRRLQGGRRAGQEDGRACRSLWPEA
jgi:L-alanine-DL-glutamate epimerase-like enolase superfamily enzyme